MYINNKLNKLHDGERSASRSEDTYNSFDYKKKIHRTMQRDIALLLIQWKQLSSALLSDDPSAFISQNHPQ
jgi:hypothetical protein